MTATHFIFFMKKLSNTPNPTGFKGYVTIPVVLAFARRVSDSGGAVSTQESMYPTYRRRGRR